MYLEIITVDRGGDNGRMFIGPFHSHQEKDAFRTHWEQELSSGHGGDHNPNQVKFVTCEQLPGEWGAIAPVDFRGFAHLPWEEEVDET